MGRFSRLLPPGSRLQPYVVQLRKQKERISRVMKYTSDANRAVYDWLWDVRQAHPRTTDFVAAWTGRLLGLGIFYLVAVRPYRLERERYLKGAREPRPGSVVSAAFYACLPTNEAYGTSGINGCYAPAKSLVHCLYKPSCNKTACQVYLDKVNKCMRGPGSVKVHGSG